MVFETQHWITRSRDQGITSQFIFDRLPGQRAWTILAKFVNTRLSYAPKENEHLSCIPLVVIFRILGISECNAASTTIADDTAVSPALFGAHGRKSLDNQMTCMATSLTSEF